MRRVKYSYETVFYKATKTDELIPFYKIKFGRNIGLIPADTNVSYRNVSFTTSSILNALFLIWMSGAPKLNTDLSRYTVDYWYPAGRFDTRSFIALAKELVDQKIAASRDNNNNSTRQIALSSQVPTM